jgi:hypothetical protein
MFWRMEETLEAMYSKWRGLLWRWQGQIASKAEGKFFYLKSSGIYWTNHVHHILHFCSTLKMFIDNFY